MEVNRWRPWLGQIFLLQTLRRFSRYMEETLRRNDSPGFFLWVALKVLCWILWSGPLIFISALLLFLAGAVLIPSLGIFYLLALALYPLSLRPYDFFIRTAESLRSKGEDALAIAGDVILLPDNYLETF